MIIKLAQPEGGGNFTGWETYKRSVLFAMDSASVLVNRQRVFPTGNWVCVSRLLCQSLQPSLHSVTKLVTPFLLVYVIHTILKLTHQCPPSKSSFSATLTSIPSEGVGSSGQKMFYHGGEELQYFQKSVVLFLNPNSLPCSCGSNFIKSKMFYNSLKQKM